jgi:hypothetical protein
MRRKGAPKPDDPEESKWFIEDAEKIASEDPDALGRALRKVAEKKRPGNKPK